MCFKLIITLYNYCVNYTLLLTLFDNKMREEGEEGTKGYAQENVENGEDDTAVFDKLGGFGAKSTLSVKTRVKIQSPQNPHKNSTFKI